MIAPEITELTRQLQAAGQHLTIETAGTVWADAACSLMSISPKLANSTPSERDGGRWAAMHERIRFQPGVLMRLMEHPYQLKFVVSRPEDLDEITSIVDQLHADRGRVLLMPEGTDQATLNERGAWTAELCKKTGFRFAPRIHVALYGNRRGT